MLSGAQILMEELANHGVDTVFGYPGGQAINIYDALYQNSHRIRHVLACHEQGAAHAADGYARATGKVGVVIATSGPGATNLVTGIATAYMDSVPLVAITGNVPTHLLGRDSFQEIDIAGVTIPITKHNFIVKDVTTLAQTVRRAFEIANSGRKGPVLIDIPKDVQVALCEYSPGFTPPQIEPQAPDPEQAKTAAQLIRQSKRPFIFAGGGVVSAGAADLLLQFSRLIDAPVTTSLMGMSAVPWDYPLFTGGVGMHGAYASTKGINECDLLIAIGTRFSDRVIGDKEKFAANAKILHIDIDEAEIGKNVFAHHFLIGDIEKSLAALLGQLEQKQNPDWHQHISRLKTVQSFDDVPDRLCPPTVIRNLCQRLEADTVVATDVGQHQMWTAQYYRFSTPRTFLTSGGLGTMGFGLGAAIGAAVGKNGKRTLLVTGDGSFHMNLQELATAVTYGLNIIILLVNNNVLGMVRQWQDIFFEKRFSNTTLDRKTDYVALAKAFGAQGVRIENYQDIDKALDFAMEQTGPVVIDCKTDPDEYVYPMIPPGKCVESIILS